MDSAPTPESPLPPPTPGAEVAFNRDRASPLVKFFWVILVVFGLTPVVLAVVAALLSEAQVSEPIHLTGVIGSGVAMVYLLIRGLKRNWAASYTGWGVIGVICVAGFIFFVAAIRKDSAVVENKNALSNARYLSSAADQYYLEHGVTSVEIYKLVGATNYMKALNPVAHESYPDILVKDQAITISGIAGLRTITYAP